MSIAGKEIRRKRGEVALFELQNKLDAEGVDPITELAKLAKDVNVPLGERVKVLRDLAQYIHPKRRAIEIGNADDEGLIVRIKKFSEKESIESKLSDEGKADLLGAEDEKN